MSASSIKKVLILGEFPVQALPSGRVVGAAGGGTCTWLLSLARELEGYPAVEIHWAVFAKGLSTPHTIKSWGQTFHLLPTRPRFRLKGFYREDRRMLARLVEEIQPAVVHGWGAEDIYGWGAVLSGRPHVLSVQGILRKYIQQRAILHPKVYFLAFMEKYLLRRAELITVESSWGEEQIRRWAPQANVRILEYGIQKLFFEAPWQPDIPAATIFVGTIDPNKGIADLVEAFRSPKLQRNELWVVGTGGRFAERLKSKAPANVRWFGRLSPAETAGRMTRATCLALPTRNDTSPNVVKEARVLGLPVLTTMCGGQRAYLVDGEDGYVLFPGDVPGTVLKLCKILQEPGLAQRLGAQGRDRYRDLFLPEKTARAFLSIYQKLAE